MGVLLETRAAGEGLATLLAGMGPGAHMGSADVPLEVAAVSEDGVAVLAGELVSVRDPVAGESGGGAETAGTLTTTELVLLEVVRVYQVVVEPATEGVVRYFF